MKEIRNKNNFMFDEFENINTKMNSIKDIIQAEDNLENLLIEFKKNINNTNDDKLDKFNNNGNNIENKQYNEVYTFKKMKAITFLMN